METNELLKKVRKIEIKTKGLSQHIFSGEYQAAFKGRGMSCSEVRDYQYGDDVRNIDWNVTARTGHPHVKVFEEERELTVMLLIDISQSAFFGTVNQLKSNVLTEICALLAFSAIHNNDKVGVIFFTSKIEKFIAPRKGRQHILRIIRELINFEPTEQQTDIGLALEYLNRIIKKRSICFLLSDFIAADYQAPLKITARRHDVVGIQVYDRRERELPKVGLIRALDAEAQLTRWLDTNSAEVRTAYSNWYQQQTQYFTSAFRKSGADTVSIATHESYVNILLQFFQKRSR